MAKKVNKFSEHGLTINADHLNATQPCLVRLGIFVKTELESQITQC